MDEARLLEVDLFAQVADVVLDDAGIAAEVVAPDVVDDLRLRHHAPGIQEQVAEQVELGRRELDRLAATPDLVCVLVHLQVRELQAPGLLGLPLRRKTACTLATSSSTLNGLVT